MSWAECWANLVVGYVLGVAVQVAVFPLFGLQIGLAGNLGLGLVFMAQALVRQYLLRRGFEVLRVRGVGQ